MAKRATTKTYAGLDVSLKETAICIVDEDGNVLKERMIPTDPDLIAKFLAKIAPNLERFGLESGTVGLAVHQEYDYASGKGQTVAARP